MCKICHIIHIPDVHPEQTALSDQGSSFDQTKPGGSDGMASAKQKGKQPMFENHQKWHSDLYTAAYHGDWEKALPILEQHGDDARKAIIDARSGETVLHVAVRSGLRSITFVQNLVACSTKDDLEVKNATGCTPLEIAARVGNLEAAKAIVNIHPDSVYIPSSSRKSDFPIHTAARYEHKEVLRYLLNATKTEQQPDPYDPEGSGHTLLLLIIEAEFYDAAFALIKRVSELGVSEKDPTLTIRTLLTIAKNPSAFAYWRNEGVFQQIIYACVPELPGNQSCWHIGPDIVNAAAEENLSDKSHFHCQGLQKLHQVLWTTLEKIVPALEHIKNEKLKGLQVKELLKELCEKAAENFKMPNDAVFLFEEPLRLAAENGIQEMVKEITDAFPYVVWSDNGELLRFVIQNHHREVLMQLCDIYVDEGMQSVEEDTKDNILHVAGRLPDSDRHRMASGAFLEMLENLKWIKWIGSLVPPSYKNQRNKDGKTPQEVFTKNHKNLMVEAMNYVKQTANSGSVVAVLILGISFGASVTVPGGIRADNGLPVLGSETAFKIFGVANASSLFGACASLLTFLSILTSHHTEGDFLRALPLKLVVGILSLFISVTSIMVSSTLTHYSMFGRGHEIRWVIGCAVVPGLLLVAMFAFGQFALVSEIIKKTYLSGTLEKRRRSKDPSFLKKVWTRMRSFAEIWRREGGEAKIPVFLRK